MNAILATQGLAASEAETKAMEDAAVKFINERYELYGRKIVVKRVIGDCPLTPPDPAKSRQAAAEVVKMNPFLVIHYATGRPETHDVWSRAGILSLGGPNLERPAFYNGRRPYRCDVFPSGTEGADEVARVLLQEDGVGHRDQRGRRSSTPPSAAATPLASSG